VAHGRNQLAETLAGVLLCTFVLPSAAAGQLLASASTNRTDAGDITSHLARVSSTTSPGVGPATLTLGSLAPVHGANAEAGAAVEAVLTAFFDDINEHGGIYNRRISMRFADAGSDPVSAARNARQLLNAPVFALVAPFAPGAEGALAGLAHERRVPLAGLLALSVPDDPTNREVFYLLPGFEQLAQELTRFAVKRQNVDLAKSIVVFGDRDLEHELVPSLQAVWKELGTGVPLMFSSSFEPTNLASMKAQGREALFVLGSGDVAAEWIEAAGKAQWYPKVFLLGPLLDDAILSSPPQLQGKMFATYPALEPSLEGLSNFDHFLERHNLSGEHRLLLMTAYCAAEMLQTALRRAGKDLTREKFLLALEQLTDFRTGLVPPITYGPKQRIGSRKAELVCVDVLTHSFEPTCSDPAKGKGSADAPTVR